MPATRRLGISSRNIRNSTKCVVSSENIATPSPNSNRTRKIVVKIKRILHKLNNNVEDRPAPSEAGTAKEFNTQKSTNDAGMFYTRKCRVRIRRVTLTSNKNIATPSPKLNRKRVVKMNAHKANNNVKGTPAITEANNAKESPTNDAGMTLKSISKNTVANEDNSTMYLTKPLRVSLRRLNTAQTPAAPAEETQQKQKAPHRFFHRDQPPQRTRSSVTRNVYEFLSESQVDDNVTNQRIDAAADIIKKMVEEGRACAIMRSKSGKTRVRAVRKRVRPVGKRKQCSLKSTTTAQLPVEQPLHMMEARPLSPIYEPEQEDNEPVTTEIAAQVHTTQLQQQQDPQKRISTQKNKTMVEGAYSPLARSLLLNQTNNLNAQNTIERRRQLLQVARKFYSTPMNRKNDTTQNNATFSPIPHQSENNQRPLATGVVTSPRGGGTSPWRVPDEAPLPNTFLFGFNTSQLPSYSSDYIRRHHVYLPDEPKEPIENNNDTNYQVMSEHSVHSAANDSNGENVPPVNVAANNGMEKTTELNGQANENENDENFVQLPNPRRTLQHRAPLKDINILDVVILPSWKNKMQHQKTPNKENVTRNHVHFANSIENTLGISPRQQSGVQERQAQSPRNLFGFEESPRQQLGVQAERQAQSPRNHLNNEEPSSKSPRQADRETKSSRNLFGFEEFINEEEEDRGSVQPKSTNITLVDKMQRLRALRPTDRELPQISKAPLRYDYDDLAARTPRQRNIKEMLCSTMIASPSSALSADESRGLFKDIDPETTFDEKKPRRTYVRERPKRKRKQRVQVLFIETDSSSSEDDEQDSNDKSADSPSKAAPAKKRVRRDVENDAKLRQFIRSFNQECKEVEQFPLIIE